MSRRAPTTVRPGGSLPIIGHDNPGDDICPVCKTSRYLNRDLAFLINPECYHPMCENCVNRIFNEGPNQCPYATCYKTLRRKGFRPPWFGDLSVEREVDIRRRVGAVFNKAEDDFETLRDYNNYLNFVEDLTQTLVAGTDDERKAAEARLAEWETQHRSEIEANRKRSSAAEDSTRRRMQAEEQAAKQRRLLAVKEDEEQRREEARWREEMLDGLAAGESGHAAQTVNRILLKKRGQGRLASAMASLGDAAGPAPSLSIRGLKEKKRRSYEDDAPYDPFGGLRLTPERFEMAEAGLYHNEWIDAARGKDEYRVGGYNVDDYIARTMFEAFAGLGVFIEEEKGLDADRGIATAGAMEAVTAGDGGGMDVDVF